MRRCASRIATRRISCSDQGKGELGPSLGFWGRAVGPLSYPRQHREGQHHQADVPVPAMPGAGLVVVQTQFGLAGLERFLDRPAPPLDLNQGLERRASRAPGGEVGASPLATQRRISRPRVQMPATGAS